MSLVFAWFGLGFFLIFLVVYGVLVSGFTRFVKTSRKRPSLLGDTVDLRAAVILSLRGDDPFLDRCLLGVTEQDYARYSVFVIIDSDEDPANARVAAFRERTGRELHVQNLRRVRSECGLKCSAILQVLESIENEFDVIALVDADTVPHRTWLRELAEPLRDPKTGATTGNRWYVPQQTGWATLTRQLWNLAALVLMQRYKIAWGGSLAIRSDVIKDCGLKDIWARSFCEDAMVGDVIAKKGFDLKFVPSVLMENRESCEFDRLVPWMRRQQRIGMLYSSRWMMILSSILFSLLPLAALLAGILWSVLMGDMVLSSIVVSLYVLYHLALTELFLPMVYRVAGKGVGGGDESAGRGVRAYFAKVVRNFVAITCLEVISVYIVLSLYTSRREEWRQINYMLEGPSQVKMLGYKPYSQERSGNAELSL